MKKIKILLLGIVSVFLLLGTAFAIEATPADREAIEKVCQQYLLDYNATRLLGKAPAADYFAAGTAAEYQMKKLELQRQETMLAHQQVPVEKIIEERFTVQEIAMNGDGAEVKAAFACTYRYALDPNTFEGVGLDSEYGEGFCFRLLRQNGQWLICDIASTDDYDYIYRSRLKARERFDPITEELLTDMDTAIQAAHEMQLDVSQVTKNSITPSSPKSTNLFLDDLDTNAMSSYAYDNASKVSPSSGDGITPYYDFSLITGNHDCTNFISHCLLAGGASKNVSANGWYYNTLSDRTPSWSNVNYLHNFLVRNSSTRGPKGVSSEYPAGNSLTSLYSSCRIGDLIQIKYKGASNYGHSTIVTGKNLSQTTILITSRTSQNSYNKSAVLTKVYNSNAVKSYRLVDLEGNYTG